MLQKVLGEGSERARWPILPRFVAHVCPGREYGGVEGAESEVAGDQGVARGEEKLALVTVGVPVARRRCAFVGIGVLHAGATLGCRAIKEGCSECWRSSAGSQEGLRSPVQWVSCRMVMTPQQPRTGCWPVICSIYRGAPAVLRRRRGSRGWG